MQKLGLVPVMAIMTQMACFLPAAPAEAEHLVLMTEPFYPLKPFTVGENLSISTVGWYRCHSSIPPRITEFGRMGRQGIGSGVEDIERCAY